jgi:hypothetical protein
MSFLITVFKNSLYEIHEDNVGIMYDLELARKFVKEALLFNSSESKIDFYSVDEYGLSICYTNGHISYTIHRMKEIKEVSDLKYGN